MRYAEFKTESCPRDLLQILQVHHLAPLTAANIDMFSEQWLPRLKPPSASAAGTQKDSPDGPPAQLTPDAIIAIKAHFKWILGNTAQKELTVAYLKKKIEGFDADKDWSTVLTLLSALGLAAELKGKKAVFELTRPVNEEVMKAVCEKLNEFFELDDKQFRCLRNKLQWATTNEHFSLATFQETMKGLTAKGTSK